MTLPPTQNQYPGWEPPKPNQPQNINDFGHAQPIANNPSNSNVPPIQPATFNQPQANINNDLSFQNNQSLSNGNQAQPAYTTFSNKNTNPINNQPEVNNHKQKKPFKGPLLLLGGMIGIFAIITGAILLTSKQQTSNNSSKPSQPSSQVTQSQSNNNTASKQANVSNISNNNSQASQSNSSDDDANQPYIFIDNKQMDNLQNLQTSLTTYQSQNSKKQLPSATPQGWALLKADNVVDPVTNNPYVFAASSNPNVGEVQYAAQSVCASDNTIIASTDLSSFALRTRLYNGTYYCVDSSNAQS